MWPARVTSTPFSDGGPVDTASRDSAAAMSAVVNETSKNQTANRVCRKTALSVIIGGFEAVPARPMAQRGSLPFRKVRFQRVRDEVRTMKVSLPPEGPNSTPRLVDGLQRPARTIVVSLRGHD